ncbi:MAG: hypothetical protein QM756_36760 [Polyangiaceae bacterium]
MAQVTLRGDTRGAVLVVGVLMGGLLVGALWHVAGIGDAAIWRERAQDAADAGAFENAVWHARGMNALAAINIVMSLILAALVVWRMALLVVTVALLVSGIFCVLSLGAECPVTVALAEVEAQMLRNDNRIATTVVRVLGSARAIETAVASLTPALAMQQATSSTRGAYDVDSARTLSASMIPSINVSGARNFAACFATGKPKAEKKKDETEEAKKGPLSKAGGFVVDTFSHPRMGVGVSLPVEEGAYKTLCTKAGTFFLNQYIGLFERAGAPRPLLGALEKVRGIMSDVIGKFPNEFCSPFGDGISDELAELLGKQSKESCDKQVDERAKTEKHAWVPGPDGLEPGYKDEEDGQIKSVDELKKSCTKRLTKKAKAEAAETIKKTARSMTECAKPAAVWTYAMNGNVFMRSFANVEHAQALAQRDLRGVQVASAHADTPAAAEAEPVLAHAEVYLDCEGAWDSCSGNAMWQLRWRARLRRVQPLRNLAATAVQPALAAWLGDVIGKLESPLKNIKDLPQYKDAKKEGTDTIYRGSAFRHAGDWLLDSPSNNPVIH